MIKKSVRIGGASGFYSDSAISVPQLLRQGDVNYIVFDYLAEGVIGSMAKLAAQDPESGFAPDFINVHVGPHLPEIMQRGIKIIANAGGVNPRGLAIQLKKHATSLGLKPRVAYVEGDDLRSRVSELKGAGYREMFSGESLPEKVTSANAYLGGFPIAVALDRGADIVITGRVVDSAVSLGVLIHEFGWRFDDYDRLSAGSLVGHLLECGAQVTGGNHTDWRNVPDWAEIGSPIAECYEDGSFVLTKARHTGGIVTVATCSEQMLYEVSDPQAYMVPDVACDWSDVKFTQQEADRVHVSGAKGLPPTATYKVCLTYDDGWRSIVWQPIMGLEATAKAERQGKAILKRTSRMLRERNLEDWRATWLEVIGSETSFGAHARRRDAREVVMRLVVEHEDKRAVELFAREQGAAITAMSVGTTLGPPIVVSPVSRVFLFLMPKEKINISVTVDGETQTIDVPTDGGFLPDVVKRPIGAALPSLPEEDGPTVPLISLVWARSGDKGNLFNVALIARKPEYLAYVRAAATPEALGDWYKHVFANPKERRIDRYDLPGTHALNFVVHNSLGGGSTSSARLDPVAKGMAQQLMEFPVPVPSAMAAELAPYIQALNGSAYEGAV